MKLNKIKVDFPVLHHIFVDLQSDALISRSGFSFTLLTIAFTTDFDISTYPS